MTTVPSVLLGLASVATYNLGKPRQARLQKSGAPVGARRLLPGDELERLDQPSGVRAPLRVVGGGATAKLGWRRRR
jgi:hypothetical protein